MASTTSTSTVSVQKPSASCGSSCSQQRGNAGRRQSCDTVCSSNSSCFLQRRKPVHPLAASLRPVGIRSGGNVVRQRLLSAKASKLKSLQSQLNDTNFHLAELAKENRALRTLQKRQDKALKNYEGVDAELPKLINKHEEEIRVLRERNKSLKRTVKEITEQLKEKDEEINNIRDQLKHLTILSKDKHLGEREKLKEELEETKETLKSCEVQISVLNRKLMLENKNCKYKMSSESTKLKQCQRELTQALAEIDRLNGLVEPGEKKKINRKRFSNLPHRQAVSCVTLGSGSTPDLNNESMSDESDTKLEPIINKRQELSDRLNGILKPPSENIKARLSTGSKDSSSADISSNLNRLSLEETDSTGNRSQLHKSIYTVSSQNPNNSRPSSSYKLEVISEKLEHSVQKSINKEMDPQLGDYCLNVVDSVKTMNALVDQHKKDFVNSNFETRGILDKLRETDDINSQLQKGEFLDKELKVPPDDLEVVNKIWYEEYKFKQSNKSRNSLKRGESIDKNGNISNSDAVVSREDKKKLLATLRAIDNGESVESVESVGTGFRRNTKLMRELFGEGNE